MAREAQARRLTIADIKGKADTRDVRVVEWPGLEGRQVGVLLLRCHEIEDAYFAARDHFSKRNLETIDAETQPYFEQELQVQLCYRMLIDPESTSPKFRLFKDPNETRSRLGPDERSYFNAEHQRLQDELVATWQRPTTEAEQAETEHAETEQEQD